LPSWIKSCVLKRETSRKGKKKNFKTILKLLQQMRGDFEEIKENVGT
jgi:hypothetical protein